MDTHNVALLSSAAAALSHQAETQPHTRQAHIVVSFIETKTPQ